MDLFEIPPSRQKRDHPEQRQTDRQLASLVKEGSVEDGPGYELTAKDKRLYLVSLLTRELERNIAAPFT
jgi:hypothetical protein